jgi:X-Pro dipeptidyl-peptidase
MRQFAIFLVCVLFFSHPIRSEEISDETVYVEAPIDTDHDGKKDLIYVEITRPEQAESLPVIMHMSPYFLGLNDASNHNVDYDELPQNQFSQFEKFLRFLPTSRVVKKLLTPVHQIMKASLARDYAFINVHSVGTGYSKGCPTVGDESEALAGKAVIDWLNGRAKAYDKDGATVLASWSNGHVGMTGVSYDGTLPNMVAATGVDGLKAIIPVAAISNWYDYYRANGLVVGPGGYIGEDADVLGYAITRKHAACASMMKKMTAEMGRENGDFTSFWQSRDYLAKAKNIKAAVFVVHGQSDWNVRQSQGNKWFDAVSHVPRRMWLHRGGHSEPARGDWQDEMYAWFDRYVKGISNGVERRPVIEVQYPDGKWITQSQWPIEGSKKHVLFLQADRTLKSAPDDNRSLSFSDRGRERTIASMLKEQSPEPDYFLKFISEPLSEESTFSGYATVHLDIAILNQRASNLTVALFSLEEGKAPRIITRGWMDPQNHKDLATGQALKPGQVYHVSFQLEPKQVELAKNTRLGILVAGTDYEHTLRPASGTMISIVAGELTYVALDLKPSDAGKNGKY